MTENVVVEQMDETTAVKQEEVDNEGDEQMQESAAADVATAPTDDGTGDGHTKQQQATPLQIIDYQHMPAFQQQQVMYIDPAYINYQQYPGMIPISTIYQPPPPQQQSQMMLPFSMSYPQQSFIAVTAATNPPDGRQQTMPPSATSFGYVLDSDAYMQQQQSTAPQLIYQPAYQQQPQFVYIDPSTVGAYQQQLQPYYAAIDNSEYAGQQSVSYIRQQSTYMDADAAGRHIAESTAASVLNSPTKKYASSQYSSSYIRGEMPNFCIFCRGMNHAGFDTHTIKNARGQVICPVLRLHHCLKCGNLGGDRAHTERYCPTNPYYGYRRYSSQRNDNYYRPQRTFSAETTANTGGGGGGSGPAPNASVPSSNSTVMVSNYQQDSGSNAPAAPGSYSQFENENNNRNNWKSTPRTFARSGTSNGGEIFVRSSSTGGAGIIRPPYHQQQSTTSSNASRPAYNRNNAPSRRSPPKGPTLCNAGVGGID